MSKVSGIKDLSEQLATKRGITKNEAVSIMSDVVEVLADAVVDGGISLKGVFTIKPKVRKGRSGTISFGENKGQQWTSEDKTVLEIKTGGDMSNRLNP